MRESQWLKELRAFASLIDANGGLERCACHPRLCGFTCEVHCLSDARGIPLVFHLSPAEAADSSLRDN
jgi:hypothetical protein